MCFLAPYFEINKQQKNWVMINTIIFHAVACDVGFCEHIEQRFGDQLFNIRKFNKKYKKEV